MTDLEPPGRVAFLELVNLTGSTILRLPVVPSPDSPSLYNISAFIPPSTFFYVKVRDMNVILCTVQIRLSGFYKCK